MNRLKDRKILCFETKPNFMVIVEYNKANAQAEYYH